MGLFSHIFCFCVSDDSGGVAQHVLNSLVPSKMVSYHAEHTYDDKKYRQHIAIIT